MTRSSVPSSPPVSVQVGEIRFQLRPEGKGRFGFGFGTGPAPRVQRDVALEEVNALTSELRPGSSHVAHQGFQHLSAGCLNELIEGAHLFRTSPGAHGYPPAFVASSTALLLTTKYTGYVACVSSMV